MPPSLPQEAGQESLSYVSVLLPPSFQHPTELVKKDNQVHSFIQEALIKCPPLQGPGIRQ